MIKVSVCIATWKRADKLKEIVLLLEKQTLSQEEYEIIIVDSKSPDHTSQVVKSLQDIYKNIIYVWDAKNILATKRNVGVENARGKVVVFMDDDVYPTADFVKAHYEANIKSENTFFCGQIRFPKEMVAISNYYFFRDQQHLKDSDIGKDLAFNKIVVMNLSFKKEYYGKTGGVDEDFVGYGGEDIEFGWRVKKAGYSLRYLPEALAIHKEDSSTIKEYGNKLYKTGLNGNRILKKKAPDVITALNNRRTPNWIRFVLSVPIILYPLEKYLIITDKNRKLYSFFLFKAYLYGRSGQGQRHQKKSRAMSVEEASKGW